MAVLWSQHFPAAEQPPSPAASPPPPPLVLYKRCVVCPTCNASWLPKPVTKLGPNLNREFVSCPNHKNNSFFKWADEVRLDEFVDVPDCGRCRAGRCRVRRERSGPNAGRILFMCTIKEGEGSCGYRVWKDELEKSTPGRGDERINLPQSPMINGVHTSPENNELVNENEQSNERSRSRLNGEFLVNESSTRPQTISAERVTTIQPPSPTVNCNQTEPVNKNIEFFQANNQSNEGVNSESSRRAQRLSEITMTLFPPLMVNNDQIEHVNIDLVDEYNECNEGEDNELPLIDTSIPKCIGVTSTKMDLLNGQKNFPNELFSRGHHKRSRNGDDEFTLSAYAPNSLVSSQSLTVGPTMNSVLVEHCWMVAAIRENLSTQLQGWWGRLAFYPKPCLMMNASKPLTFHVSSPLDPTFTAQDDKTLANSGDLTTLSKILLGAETYNKPLLNPCHNPQLSRIELKYPPTETNTQNFISKSISNAFGQAAEQLQNEFLAKLVKQDVANHEAMSLAAQDTFAALDHLLFDHRDFKRRTEEYIRCATSLAEIERSMPGDDLHRKLVERCSSARIELDEINSAHAEAVDSVNYSKKRLKLVQEEVSVAMEWLFQIEAELWCCEVEMSSKEGHLEKIRREKEDSEDNYLTAAYELERSKELIHRKEAERIVAKAAFERAKESLKRLT